MGKAALKAWALVTQRAETGRQARARAQAEQHRRARRMVRAIYTFGTEDRDAGDYWVCWRVTTQRGGRQFEEKNADREERLLAALKAIGDPVGPVVPRVPDAREHELKPSGGQIDVELDDMLLLLDYLKLMPFLPQWRAAARETRDRISLGMAQHEVASEEPKQAERPRAVREKKAG